MQLVLLLNAAGMPNWSDKAQNYRKETELHINRTSLGHKSHLKLNITFKKMELLCLRFFGASSLQKIRLGPKSYCY